MILEKNIVFVLKGFIKHLFDFMHVKKKFNSHCLNEPELNGDLETQNNSLLRLNFIAVLTEQNVD